MFNDILTLPECEELVRTRLAACAFPFRCAHGRPSLVVLGGLGDAEEKEAEGEEEEEEGKGFLDAFERWQAGGTLVV